MGSQKIVFFSRTFATALIFVLFSGNLLIAFRGGPPNGRTGAPGEPTCNDSGCHNNFSLNSGSGSFVISGIPSAGYEPGKTYIITLQFSSTPGSVFGFEAVVLDASNSSTGTLAATEANSTLSGTSKIYVKHTNPKNSGMWQFSWTAPEVDEGTITIYAAGNAANNNFNNQGDFIYTATLSRSADIVTAVGDDVFSPSRFLLHGNYPNPFNPATNISYELERPGRVILRIYDVGGREVRTLVSGEQPAGSHTVNWDGKNNAGREVASGVYITRLTAGSLAAASRMLLVR